MVIYNLDVLLFLSTFQHVGGMPYLTVSMHVLVSTILHETLGVWVLVPYGCTLLTRLLACVFLDVLLSSSIILMI
jgi:type IV secretory pathway TrbL component